MKKSQPPLSPMLIALLGPTACGKTRLAIQLAYQFRGEIVSADSRQVYRGLDLGTGKDLPEYHYQGQDIPYHLIDVADPQDSFTLADYQKLAYQAIDDIQSRQKLPFLVGGSGLYLQSIIDGLVLPPGQPDSKLRQKLDAMPAAERLALLKETDPGALKIIDTQNPRRVIRALEISLQGRQKFSQIKQTAQPRYSVLQIGVSFPIETIRQRIRKRLKARLDAGLIKEVQQLHQSGLSFKKLDQFGLEYRYVAQYLQKELTRAELEEQLAIAIGQFAKRQLTWFKRDPRIHWLKDPADSTEAAGLIRSMC